MAGGIDRSGQSIGPLFETGTYAELSFGVVSPELSGNDVALFGGGASGDTTATYTQIGLAWKNDINDRLSYAVILDEPFGADIRYAPTSVALGGTYAEADSLALTALLRYKTSERFSVYGGLKAERASGEINLQGAAYGPVSGYNVTLDDDIGYGFVVGAAYEVPEIALRVALTYSSEIEHSFDTVETLGGGVIGTGETDVTLPQSVNLDFQTGIAQDTLLFGTIRWVDWSTFEVNPATFVGLTGGGLVSLDNSVTYTLGVGRRFNETWSGSAFVTFEEEKDPLVSPLAPSTGQLGLGIAAVYTRDNMKITTGVRYVSVGDAQPETGTPDTARANFSNNYAIAAGVRVGFSF